MQNAKSNSSTVDDAIQMLQASIKRNKKRIEEEKAGGANVSTIKYFEKCIKNFEDQIVVLIRSKDQKV